MVRSATVALLAVICTSTPVLAADRADEKKNSDALPLVPRVTITETAKRPAALPTLYASLAALQIYDGYSTIQGQSRGAREANPAMQWMAASPARFWTVKAATTAASIAIAERMWKRNKVGAIVTMVAVNGISAAVAARNASVLKQTR